MDDGSDRALGPLATVLGQVFVVGALLVTFGVLFDRLPGDSATALLLPAWGCVVLAPRALLRTVRVSAPLLLLVIWATASWVWSVAPERTLDRLWSYLPLVVAMVAVTAVLPTSALWAALRANVRLVLLLNFAAVATSASARISGDAEFVVAGWRGTFPDKNSLALYLVFALAVVLVLDRGVSRWGAAALITVLLAGAQSATGLSVAVLVVVTWLWLGRLRCSGRRQSALFVLSSIGVALCGFALLLSSTTQVLELYGRDTSLTGRTDIWAAVLGAIADRPLTGYGLGALLDLGAPSTVTRDLWREIGFEAVHAHNGVLDLVGQLGLIGLVLYLLALGTTLATAVSGLRVLPLSGTFAIITVSAQLVMSVAENVLLGPWLLVLVVLQAPLLGSTGADGRLPGPSASDLEVVRRPGAVGGVGPPATTPG